MNQYLTQKDCISKLGKRIQNLRTDRPDEWTMDEFIRDADNMQKKINEYIDESIAAVKRAMPNDTHTRRLVIREIEALKTR